MGTQEELAVKSVTDAITSNAKKTLSDIDKRLDAIKSTFKEEFEPKQSDSSFRFSSSGRRNISTNGDSSATRDNSSSKKERPKTNRVETKSELPDPDHQTIHGFINETLFLKNFLLKRKESKEFKTLAVVGKHGVGKTTLCQVVFNDEDVRKAYLPRIWVSMYSEETKEDEDPKIAVVKRILRSLGVQDEMLKRIESEAVEEKRVKEEKGVKEEDTVEEKKLSRLLDALHLNLFGKKYLIVLDDVCEDNEWNQRLVEDEKTHHGKPHLSCGFPKGFGGRVIVTSRDASLAKKIVGEEEENLLRLFPRIDAESVWKIYIDAVATLGIEVNPRYPGRFREELMDKSCGIPLVARMLAKKAPVKVEKTEKTDETVKMEETVKMGEPSGDMEKKKSV